MKAFHYLRPSANLLNLCALSECLGISSELVEVGSCSSLIEEIRALTSPSDRGAILDLTSLRHALDAGEIENVALAMNACSAKFLLVINEVDASADRIVKGLTGGAVTGVGNAEEPKRVVFPISGAPWSRELAGNAYPRSSDNSLSLVTGHLLNADSIINLDNYCSFLRVPLENSELFVWAALAVMDPLAPLSLELEFELATDKYIPAIIFLRTAFDKYCWHNADTSAAIVIDDPLLEPYYGFIDFSELLESARKHRYRVTLAFIPWNARRSRNRRVQTFVEHEDCFGVAVHGCDHTDNEYGSEDYDLLLGKNIVASNRMARLAAQTGLRYESVMVCPQEKYSLQAMQAFTDSGRFLGLVNTSCQPRNLSAPMLSAADLLLPAQDSFFGFPVFKRHYWTDMSVFAMDRFLGKPTILVEHHDFFRDKCAAVEEFASLIYNMNQDVAWKPLSQILSGTYSQKCINRSDRAIRFFTAQLRIRHSGDSIVYHFSKRLPRSCSIRQILVNESPVPFSREEDMVIFRFAADRPQTIDVRIEQVPIKPAKAYPTDFKYQAQVGVRRILSEFRDNVVSKSPLASSLLRAIKSRNVQSRA